MEKPQNFHASQIYAHPKSFCSQKICDKSDKQTLFIKVGFMSEALFNFFRVIEQYCFNSTQDPSNGQTANFILKPPKVIESRTYVKKANLECY